jgi:hypothetical protein
LDRILERRETYAAVAVTAAAVRAAQTAIDREFCDCMTATRTWKAVGCCGSVTVPQSAISARAWPHLRVIDWERSMLVEPDGSTIWYDVIILPAGAELAPPASSKPPERVEPESKREEAAEAEATRPRPKRDPLISVLETLAPAGVHPKGMSIRRLTDRINKLPEFKENQVSDDTVGRALKDMKAAVKK